jgi:Raf kinase inhibitor-like YbhB/YbcL family protein
MQGQLSSRRLSFAAALLFTVYAIGSPAQADSSHDGRAQFHLVSSDIAAGQKIAAAQVFNGFGCSGKNISPALSWEKAPAGTKSFALMVHDPDAPTGSGWWHWVVINIPANTTALPANAGDPASGLMPKGAAQGRTDFGSVGYGGPCPPAGDKPHRYYFRLHALKVAHIDVPDGASAALVGFNVKANTIATR